MRSLDVVAVAETATVSATATGFDGRIGHTNAGGQTGLRPASR